MEASRDVGILFADIVGSTLLYERLGDQIAVGVVHETLASVGRAVAAHRGRVVKTIGDEVMAVFDDPQAGFAAAIEIRGSMSTLPPLPGSGGQVRLRIGLHFGPAVIEDGDCFGDTVNIAARLVHLANPDQILTTGDLIDRLPPEQQDDAAEFAVIEVKGRQDPVRVAQVTAGMARQETTQIGFARSAPPPRTSAVTLTLTVQGRTWAVPAGTRRLVCGRDAACDVVVAGAQVSRQHATVEFRRDKVILIDHSSNGTTLVVRDERPVALLREEFGMLRAGHIIFGRLNEPGAVVIGYSIA
ncbi:MAG: adenylate/guanylate cyclase domain-containing protein [Gemmobacter sp.]